MKRPFQERERRSGRALERASGMPLYRQMVALLTNRIRTGSVGAGEYLPSESDLCTEFGVSRITARRAMNELAQAGLVARERGRGTRVIENRLSPVYRASIDGWRESVSMLGRRTSVQVLSFDYVPAARDVAEALEIEAGESVQHTVRVRRLGSGPFSHLVTHVPEEIGRLYRRKDLGDTPLHKLLEGAGVTIASARQTLTATLADPPLASVLDIPLGSPLIEVERVVRDDTGRPVQHIRVRYRPDLYCFEMTMDRSDTAAGTAPRPVSA